MTAEQLQRIAAVKQRASELEAGLLSGRVRLAAGMEELDAITAEREALLAELGPGWRWPEGLGQGPSFSAQGAGA